MADTSTTTTGITGAGGGNMLRITGMASGLDVDAMVKKMMAGQQTKIDEAKQAQQLVQWKKDAYQDIIKDVKDFQSTYFDPLKSDTYILSDKMFSCFDTTVTDPTVLSATALVGAKAGAYTVSFGSDGHLASAAAIEGSMLNASKAFTATTNWDGGTTAKTIGFTVNGGTTQTITLSKDYSNDTTALMNDINDQISANTSLNGKIKACLVDAGADGKKVQFQVLSSDIVKMDSSTTTVADLSGVKGKVINPSLSNTMSDLGLGAASSIQFTYNGTSYTVDVNTTDKISDVINNINLKTGGKVTGSFNQLSNKFTIQSATTGSSNSIQITSDFSPLGLANGTSDTGEDALVYITEPGGTSTAVSKSSNSFAIDGISYNLNKKQDTTFTVTQDADKVYDKINDFITKYNTIIDKIQTKLSEKKNKDYKPLTDSQKSSMSTSDITSWETKAKEGILRNDDNLSQLLTSLRSSFTGAVKGNTLNFGKYGTNAIGIDTSDDQSNGGKMYIADKTKLLDVIKNHSDQLQQLFCNTSTNTDATQKFNEQGIFSRVKSIFESNVGMVGTTYNSSILTKYANFQDDYSVTGSSGTNTLPDQIYRQQQIITELNQKYQTQQEAYYKQFSTLETTLNSLNTQQSWLSQQFSG